MIAVRSHKHRFHVLLVATILLLVVPATSLFLPISRETYAQNPDVCNDTIADIAVGYDGQWGGQCKAFVYNVDHEAGGSLGTGYRQCYLDEGVEISWSSAVRGDIIQLNKDSDPETYYTGMHTAIVLQNYGNGTFQVVDSNWNWDEIVHIHDWNPFNQASQYGLTAHFYRLGMTDCGGTCSAPSLNSPGDGYVHTSTDRTITFSWSAPSNCTPDGYTFRVKTVPDMDSGGTTIFDEGQRGTQVTKQFGSEWDNTDLYWSVRACKPCTPYNPGPWAPSRRFRIAPDQATHRECSNNQCVTVTGPGTDQCSSESDCGPPPGDWYVEYFPNTNLTDLCATGSHSGTFVLRDWQEDRPSGNCPSDNWSARFRRRVHFQTGSYTFGLGGDDWARILVEFPPNEVVVDFWKDKSQHYESRYINEGDYWVTVEFADTTGLAWIAAWWWGPGFDMPRESRDPNQWYAEYWGNKNLSWDAIIGVNEGSGQLSHAWDLNGPGYGLPSERFSSRFQRSVYFDCGRYRFHVFTDDGARFWIDGQLKLDKWFDGVNGYDVYADLTAGNHDLELKHYENGGAAAISFEWFQESGCPVNAPSNLSATAVSQTQINLTWDDNSDNEEGYTIYRNGVQVGQVGTNIQSYQDTGLSEHTAYSYYVKAFRGGIESDPSNTINVITPLPTPPPFTGWGVANTVPDVNLWKIDMLSQDKGWIVGGWCCNPWISTVLHWKGTNWQEMVDAGSYQLFAVDMVNATEGWVGGQFGALQHFLNDSWEIVTSPTPVNIRDIEMLSASEGWAVGHSGYPDSDGVLLHFVDGAWHVYSFLSNKGFYAIDMISASDGWIVGGGTSPEDQSLIYHYDGASWQRVTSPTDRSIRDVEMLSSSEGWAVAGNAILRYVNDTWDVFDYPAGSRYLYGLDMLSSSEGWAVGEQGTILHYLDGLWHSEESPTTESLYDVQMTSNMDGWAVGWDGTILRYVGTSVPSGVCEPDWSLSCGGSDKWSNDEPGSTDQIDSYSCSPWTETGPEYTYTFIPDVSGEVDVTLTGLSGDLDVFVMDDAGAGCSATNCIAYGDETATFDVEAGQTYYLVVDGYYGAISDYTITVNCSVNYPPIAFFPLGMKDFSR